MNFSVILYYAVLILTIQATTTPKHTEDTTSSTDDGIQIPTTTETIITTYETTEDDNSNVNINVGHDKSLQELTINMFSQGQKIAKKLQNELEIPKQNASIVFTFPDTGGRIRLVTSGEKGTQAADHCRSLKAKLPKTLTQIKLIADAA